MVNITVKHNYIRVYIYITVVRHQLFRLYQPKHVVTLIDINKTWVVLDGILCNTCGCHVHFFNWESFSLIDSVENIYGALYACHRVSLLSFSTQCCTAIIVFVTVSADNTNRSGCVGFSPGRVFPRHRFQIGSVTYPALTHWVSGAYRQLRFSLCWGVTKLRLIITRGS
jgi:hypothetical protein